MDGKIFIDHYFRHPVTLKVLQQKEETTGKSGVKSLRYLCMDIKKDYVTVSLFANMIQKFPLTVGVWYLIRGCGVNNYQGKTGIALRWTSSVQTLEKLGIAIPQVEDPITNNLFITGKLISLEGLEDYIVCPKSRKR